MVVHYDLMVDPSSNVGIGVQDLYIHIYICIYIYTHFPFYCRCFSPAVGDNVDTARDPRNGMGRPNDVLAKRARTFFSNLLFQG